MVSFPVLVRLLWLAVSVSALALAGCGRLGFDAQACSGALPCSSTDPSQGTGDAAAVPDGATSDEGGATGDGAVSGGADAGDHGDTADGGPLEPPTGSPRCGSLELLQEDFDDGDSGGHWFTHFEGEGEVTLDNQRLELQVQGGAGVAEASYGTHSSRDFRGSELAVEVSPGGVSRVGIELRDGKGIDRYGEPVGPAQRGVAMVADNGMLKALTLDAETEETVASVSYDAVTHRHWRMREQAGAVFWETSVDRSSWSLLHTQAVTMDSSHVLAWLFAREPGVGSGEAWFDNLNVPAASVPGYCSASTLRDGFDDGELGPEWTPWNGAGTCTVTEQDARVELGFAREFSACALKSSARFDLRDAAISFELVEVPTAGAFSLLAELADPRHADVIELRIRQGAVLVNMLRDEVTLFTSTRSFDAVAMRFWRVRESEGNTYWEASPDGSTWSGVADARTDIDVRAVSFELWGFQSAAAAGPAEFVVDSVNVP